MNAIHAERSIDTHEQLIHLIRKEMWQGFVRSALKGLVIGLLSVIVPVLVVAWWVA